MDVKEYVVRILGGKTDIMTRRASSASGVGMLQSTPMA